jgi:hypothetical protein
MIFQRPTSNQAGVRFVGVSKVLGSLFIIVALAFIAPAVVAAAVTNTSPRAFHQLVVVPPSGEAVIRLNGYDFDGDKVSSFLSINIRSRS